MGSTRLFPESTRAFTFIRTPALARVALHWPQEGPGAAQSGRMRGMMILKVTLPGKIQFKMIRREKLLLGRKGEHENFIFNASGGVGRQLDILVGLEGVDGLYQADGEGGGGPAGNLPVLYLPSGKKDYASAEKRDEQPHLGFAKNGKIRYNNEDDIGRRRSPA